MAELQPVYFIDALRTPLGRIRGGLSAVRPDDLLAEVLGAAVARNQLLPHAISEVIAGCANQAGEDNRNVARMATLLAGLSEDVPAVTVNRLCASGLSAVNMAARQIACGEAEIILAGGVESMTRAPWVMAKGEVGFSSGNQTVYDTALGWRFPNPRMEKHFPLEPMGETAENLVDDFGISREDQDQFAFESHQKALAAQKAGRFNDEIVPVKIPQRKGEPIVFSFDEGPRVDTTIEKLSSLSPAFRKGGSVTAGNSSTLNDGAACVVLASAKAVERYNLKPRLRWLGSAAAGVSPTRMGIGPVPAVRRLLERHSMRLEDIDLIELNEAFAAQSLAVLGQLDASAEVRSRVNVNGGAIALGHPLGCSGVRILTTLFHEMGRRGSKRGLATLCVGVGQGDATLVEAVL